MMKTRTIKLTITYDGTHFAGWQIQPGKRTVQGVITAVLEGVTGEKITLVGASRTDAGVHALGQVAHFHTRSRISPFKLLGALNGLLPPDIAVLDVQEGPQGFHAQKSAKKKTYQYLILNTPVRHPLLAHRAWHVRKPLNLKEMRQAARVLIGRHDFRAFQGRKPATKTTIRRIYKMTVSLREFSPSLSDLSPTLSFRHPTGGQVSKERETEEPKGNGAKRGLVHVSITGNGFLKQMVRNIVGLLVFVGEGKRPVSDVKKVLQSRDRKMAGVAAPGHGLYLVSVE